MTSLTAAERLQFEAQGYLVWPEALDRAALDEVNGLLNGYEAETKSGLGLDFGFSGSDNGGEGSFQLQEGALRSIMNPIDLDNLFLDLALHPNWFPKVSEMWGGNLRLISSTYFSTPPGSPPSLGWHTDVTAQDYPGISFSESLMRGNLLIMLTDTAPENGPTIVIPGSHRWPGGRQLPDEWYGRSDPESFDAHVKITGKAGTVWFFNSRLTHAQTPNYSDITRRLLIYVFAQRFQREWPPGFTFRPERLEQLSTSPIRAQLLGLSSPWGGDEPSADYEVPDRWAQPAEASARGAARQEG